MKKKLVIRDLGRQPYQPVFELQEELVQKRMADEIPDTLILVEHDAVYTMGRNADKSNITASVQQLSELGIDVVDSTRGGDVTYHGPGQIVGYPIIDLGSAKRQVHEYVSKLEETLIRSLGSYGIEAGTDPANRGVWIGREKVAAIGIRISRRVTMHGFALNVKVNLGDYIGIVACGIQDRGVTSLDRFVPDVTMEDVKGRVITSFIDVFDYEL